MSEQRIWRNSIAMGRRAFAILSYVAGIVWICLFPFVSISTGELKPRSIFIDENGILVQSLKPDFLTIPVHTPTLITATSHAICSYFQNSTYAISGGVTLSCTEHFDVASVLVPTVSKPLFKETNVLCFPLHAEGGRISTSMLHFASALLGHLTSAPWLASNILLQFPILSTSNHDSALYSSSLSDWLRAYHYPIAVGPLFPYYGLIRHAFIYSNTSTSSTSAFATVSAVGANGVQPNMDMIATLLALPRTTLSGFSGAASDSRASVLSKLTLMIHSIASALRPSGLHAYYQQYNIDAASVYDMSASNLLLTLRVFSNLQGASLTVCCIKH